MEAVDPKQAAEWVALGGGGVFLLQLFIKQFFQRANDDSKTIQSLSLEVGKLQLRMDRAEKDVNAAHDKLRGGPGNEQSRS